jgi:hypothetical protein
MLHPVKRKIEKQITVPRRTFFIIPASLFIDLQMIPDDWSPIAFPKEASQRSLPRGESAIRVESSAFNRTASFYYNSFPAVKKKPKGKEMIRLSGFFRVGFKESRNFS